MSRKRDDKYRTITGKRIPIELDLEVRKLQRAADLVGKRLSYQDSLRTIVKNWRKRKY